MLEAIAQLVILAVVGLVIGVGVLVYQENETVRGFFTKRPVLAFPLATVTGGIVAYLILYVLWVILLATVGAFLK